MTPPLLTAGLPVLHGFFTRQGGVSSGPFASLNCSLSGKDDPAAVAENRRRAAAALGVDRLIGLFQVHGAEVAVLETPWGEADRPRADAAVTRLGGVGLAIVTADCAPVLFADAEARVVGAAHAGWRGAIAGVLEATVAAMERLGARRERVLAAIGPCIRQPFYEVGEDVIVALGPTGAPFLAPAARPDRRLFDLPGYCAARLVTAGVPRVFDLGLDTYTDEARFFSHRRAMHGGGGPIGHQLSAIALPG
ncbi:polyphenol oxidase family protein [Elioraea thermophila]|uniref:polyphenol oxidase family protein n=1 Tax=Elioraea thermophila TaxID=2185104 RepID=UPI000DF1E4EF|nr:polyphenol oxidase family protein [Elioraea thermophila]